MPDLNGYTVTRGAPFTGKVSADLRAPPRGTAKSSTKPVIFSASDLRRREFEPIRYVVPGYLAEGCTLLAGRPKLGKSWLVLDIALAVAHGGECLGNIACEEGDVLYLALEDNERRLQRRIDKVFGIVRDWPPRLDIATEWPRSNEGGIEAIREWILSKEKPRLVIVDVLAMFKPVRGDKESLYEADYLSIKGLQSLAGEFGVAIVVVHHTRKSGVEADPFEKVSGTLGLSGAADTTVILDRDGNGATLYGRGRDVEEIEEAVAFSRDTCRWTVQGKAEEVRRSDERGIILDALKEADEPMGPREIAIATAMPRNNVDQLLFKLAKAGEVRKIGRGVYVHPDRADLIAAHEATPDKNDKKIRNVRSAEEDEGGNGDGLLTDSPAPIRNTDTDLADDPAVEEALLSIRDAMDAGAPEAPRLLALLVQMAGKEEVGRLATKMGLNLGGDDA